MLSLVDDCIIEIFLKVDIHSFVNLLCIKHLERFNTNEMWQYQYNQLNVDFVIDDVMYKDKCKTYYDLQLYS